MLSRQEGPGCRHTEWRVCDAVGKANGGCRELIQMRAAHLFVAITSEIAPPVLVRKNEQQIRCHGRSGYRSVANAEVPLHQFAGSHGLHMAVKATRSAMPSDVSATTESSSPAPGTRLGQHVTTKLPRIAPAICTIVRPPDAKPAMFGMGAPHKCKSSFLFKIKRLCQKSQGASCHEAGLPHENDAAFRSPLGASRSTRNGADSALTYRESAEFICCMSG